MIKRLINMEKAQENLSELLSLLPDNSNNGKYWSIDGDEVLTATSERAESLADFIESVFTGCIVNTGYYDPLEDERNGTVDARTGCYYVTIE